jgi:16S rRNA (uracil1498-N3)-methyltransferase
MTAGPDGRHGPHAFVADLERPELSPEDRHHLGRVLRMRPGDPLTVSDGRGGWRPCRFGDELEPTGPIAVVAAPRPGITIAFAPTKADRPEWVVQKLTELGADVIVPVHAERSVVRWGGERAARQHERLVKVAREAAMQCRRCHLPDVHPITGFAAVAGWPESVRAERGGAPPSLERPTVVVGPEGGWTDEERRAIPATMDLGDHVLRAETAAITAMALLAALRAGRVTAG